MSESFSRLVVRRLEFDSLQIEDDVGHVLDHAGQSGEFVLRAGDFDRGDGGAFQRGEQHAAERIANRVAVTGFKRLGDEFWRRFPWRRSRLSRESSAFQNDRNELA